jgi:predicted nucleotide-binding protein
VCLLKGDDVDIPSDLHGVVYIPLNAAWQVNVLREMRHAGLPIDLNRL